MPLKESWVLGGLAALVTEADGYWVVVGAGAGVLGKSV